MFESLLAKVREINTQREQLSKELFELIKKEIVSILKKYPEFIGIRWTQYVPGYNDGDTCFFTINEPEFISSISSDKQSFVQIGENYYPIVDLIKEWDSDKKKYIYPDPIEEDKVNTLNKITQVIYTIEDLLEEQFGSNAEVIITKEEIIVNTYDY